MAEAPSSQAPSRLRLILRPRLGEEKRGASLVDISTAAASINADSTSPPPPPPLKVNRAEMSDGPVLVAADLRSRLRPKAPPASSNDLLDAAAVEDAALVTFESAPLPKPAPVHSAKRVWKNVLKAVEKQQSSIDKSRQRFINGRSSVVDEFSARVKEIWTFKRLAMLTGSASTAAVASSSKGAGAQTAAASEAEYLKLLEREVKSGTAGAETTMALFKWLDSELNRAHAELAVMALQNGGSALLNARPSESHVAELLTAGGFVGQLMPFQVEGLQWLLARYRCGSGAILADEMGLGKTVQAIALLHAVRRENKRPTLILVPLSTMGNWEGEFERFGGEDGGTPLRVLALRGDAAATRAQLKSFVMMSSSARRKSKAAEPVAYNYDVVLVPHHRFSKMSDPVVKTLLPVEWGYVMVDEAQRIKNAKSQMTQILLRTKSTHRLALTGTPLQNDLLELWSLMTFLLPTVFSKRENQLKLIFEQFTGRQKDARNGAFADSEEREVVLCTKLHQLFEPILLRREKREVVSQLPSLTETTIYCPVTSLQQVALEDALKSTTHVHRTAAKVLLHPFSIQETFLLDDALLTNSGKFSVMDIIIRFLNRCHTEDSSQPPHKVLIFSSWIVTLDMVGYYCDWRGFKYVRLDGRVSLDDRHTAMKTFAEDPTCSLFLISKGAGGVGLNLQSADTVLLLDVHYNPQSDLQALARAWRVGQKREVKVIRLVTDTAFERRVMDISSSKVAVEQKVIGAGRYNLHSTVAERESILRDVLVGSTDVSSEGGASKAFYGASGSTITQVEAHLAEALIEGLCRGGAEKDLMRRMIESEGLLNDLLAAVTSSPTTKAPPRMASNSGGAGGQTVNHKLHELREGVDVLGSDEDEGRGDDSSNSNNDDDGGPIVIDLVDDDSDEDDLGQLDSDDDSSWEDSFDIFAR